MGTSDFDYFFYTFHNWVFVVLSVLEETTSKRRPMWTGGGCLRVSR